MTSQPDFSPKERAPAKINLFLHVGERGADGFHGLQSLVVFADAGDVLTFAPAADLSLEIGGPFAGALAADDNLVLRAARKLAAMRRQSDPENDTGANITLTKNLPVASGLGGGSADAAAALRGLAKLWNLDVAAGTLLEVAAGLGSDIPVCVAAKPAWMEGRGEILTTLSAMPRLPMLLVNPGVGVPTREVFANLAARSGTAMSPMERFEDTADLLRFIEVTANDLEAPARALCPVIGEVLNVLANLPGALFTSMSGSGATCFAILPDDGACARAARMLAANHPGWWIVPTATAGIGMTEREPRTSDIGPTPDGI